MAKKKVNKLETELNIEQERASYFQYVFNNFFQRLNLQLIKSLQCNEMYQPMDVV